MVKLIHTFHHHRLSCPANVTDGIPKTELRDVTLIAVLDHTRVGIVGGLSENRL